MPYSLIEANKIIEDHHLDFFNKCSGLTLIYTKKEKESNFYEIICNLDPISNIKLNEAENMLQEISGEDGIIVHHGTYFSTLSSDNNSNLYNGSWVKNTRSKKKGRLGFLFKYRKDIYLVSNQHVIGRTYGDPFNDMIRIKANNSTSNYKNFAKYQNGEITNFVDLAIAKINNKHVNEILSESFPLQMDIKIEPYEEIVVQTIEQKIVSTNAYAVIKGNDFYNPFKILKNQILTDIVMWKGCSGSIVENTNEESVGLLFAKNSNFSLVNNINQVIDKICDFLKCNKNEIQIINSKFKK